MAWSPKYGGPRWESAVSFLKLSEHEDLAERVTVDLGVCSHSGSFLVRVKLFSHKNRPNAAKALKQ